jgi:membrane-associated phospholipid phosphatase
MAIITNMILLNSGDQAGFFQRMIGFDHWLFSKINQQWTNPFFDAVFPFLRQAEIWLPFYLFLLLFITMNFGKKGWLWSFSLIMTAVISDLLSSSVIKHLIFRYRPCCDPSMEDKVRILVNYCPYNSSSFTSSHACNHFAMATFIYLTLRETSRWWSLVFAWAFVICYAQVYVGVHFPFDIVGGTILGCLIGYGMSVFFRKQFGPLTLKQTI